MIEGINASIATASLIRANVDQVASVHSGSANPDQVQQIPQAPYISPRVSIDYTNRQTVLQFRDSDTGEVVSQIPTDSQLKAYRRTEPAASRKPDASSSSENIVVASPSDDPVQDVAPAPVGDESGSGTTVLA